MLRSGGASRLGSCMLKRRDRSQLTVIIAAVRNAALEDSSDWKTLSLLLSWFICEQRPLTPVCCTAENGCPIARTVAWRISACALRLRV
jgi:hypothetical protein